MRKQTEKQLEFEEDILELIDNQDEFTRGDLQGVVSVLVTKILEAGYECKRNSTD